MTKVAGETFGIRRYIQRFQESPGITTDFSTHGQHQLAIYPWDTKTPM
jgi:hypothetical protein